MFVYISSSYIMNEQNIFQVLKKKNAIFQFFDRANQLLFELKRLLRGSRGHPFQLRCNPRNLLPLPKGWKGEVNP